MEAIGGYFSLELPQQEEYHKDALRLSTGRNCLEYILRVRGYKTVYIPYYSCEVLMEPFKKLGIHYEFYYIDIHLEIVEKIELNAGEALLYINYFGLKQRYVEQLAKKVGTHLIVDNTQAFYAKPIGGIDTFYSCRKFFGVPDGAYLYCDAKLDEYIGQDHQSLERMNHLLKRIAMSAEDGYSDFRRTDDGLDNQPILRMSKLTKRIMQSIDYEASAKQRRANYKLLCHTLGKANSLKLPLSDDAVPMVYPHLSTENDLREVLIKKKIFVACYWPNVLEWVSKDKNEYLLASKMQPLPVDQRYGKEEMKYILNTIQDNA